MSAGALNIEINGVPLKARKGAMIIEVADGAGIRIPRFCYHAKLSVAANCRMCLVEVEKAPKPLPACATPVAEGMKVLTASPLAVAAQRSVMEFLLINHPLDCPICDQGGECELQDVAMGYGRGISRFQERKRVVPDPDLGPLIATDMTRCIHCTRCVRFGDEIAGLPELGATGRGEQMRIGTFIERSVDSELSGNVIDLCPVGALTSKPFRFRARAWEMQQRDGVAPHDAVGSNVSLHVHQNRVLRVVPRENEAVNEVWLSDRDRFSYQGLYSDDRLTTPRVKQDGEWREVDWETALAAAASGLRRCIASHGARQLGALASPSATCEEHYLLQKLMRGIGCANLDHRLRQSDFSDQDELPAFPYLGQSLRELEDVGAALLVGSYCRKEQPLVNHRLRKAAGRGAAVMAINVAGSPFNFELREQVVASPARMLAELAGIARALSRHAPAGDPDVFSALLAGTRSNARQRRIARQLADAERATVLLGATAFAHPQAAVLRSLAGCIAERASAALGYLSDGANSAGAALAGMLPHRGPGGEPAAPRGLDVAAMLALPLKAFVLLGIEPELDCADSARALRALDAAALVVVLSAYVTPAMQRYADVLLPIAAFAETSGTFVNAQGAWQRFQGAVAPPGDARPAWKVLRVLGNLLELDGFEQVEPGEVHDELRSRAGGELPANARAWRAPASLPGARNGLTRVGEVPIYAVDAPVRRASALQRTADARDAAVRVNARLAAKLGLAGGARAVVSQGDASRELPVVVDATVADGCVALAAGVPGSVGLGPSFGPITVDRAQAAARSKAEKGDA